MLDPWFQFMVIHFHLREGGGGTCPPAPLPLPLPMYSLEYGKYVGVQEVLYC